jgi:hypothetical protein
MREASSRGPQPAEAVCRLQRRVACCAILGLALASCSGAKTAADATADGSGSSSERPLEFEFPGVGDEGSVSSATTRGRVTLLAFVATYDLASQILLRNIAEVIVGFTPRVNAAAVVLEAPRYAELVPAYRSALGLPYPVVMADFATQQGQGPFGDIERVPVTVVLDREGRQVSRAQGSLTPGELEAALRRASRH